MRRGRTLRRAAALAAAFTLFMVGTARADGFIDQTHILVHASPGTRVAPDTTVTISGELRADHAFCRIDTAVNLRMFGDHGTPGGLVDTTKTASGGRFSFTVAVTEQTRFRVWFRGKVGGVHPDIKTCRKNRSRVVTIFMN